eukprot:SAG31_NODE_2380_length_5833_cov_1.859435_2_plen_288_part_00
MGLLFRLVEVSSGAVRIDGHDISCIGLKRLRQAINIIPQDPILLEGTVRSNLDPFWQYSDAEVQKAIHRVMDCIVDRNKATSSELQEADGKGATTSRIEADMEVKKDGNNFSAGERQLLALARAFLYDRKIIVMDEPTANIDTTSEWQTNFPKSHCCVLLRHAVNAVESMVLHALTADEKIQPLVREAFEGHTLLTIAHRLNTIITSAWHQCKYHPTIIPRYLISIIVVFLHKYCAVDKILVLSEGEVVEYDTPVKLLDNRNGDLSTMVDALGAASVSEPTKGSSIV